MCPICQDLVAPAYAMVPCGHVYCGECLAGWLDNKRDCPTCRQKVTAPPVRQTVIDGCIAAMEAQLDPDERATRAEKQQVWEQGRAGFERQLNKPWARAEPGAAAGGRHRRGPPPGLATALGSSDIMHQMMAALQQSSSLMAGLSGGMMQAPPPALPRRRHVPPPRSMPAMPPVNEYRVEYAPACAPACTACRGAMPPNALRVGMRQMAQSVYQAAADFSWFHLQCMPRGSMSDARLRGLSNLRSIAPADQARVRERMTLTGRRA